MTETTSALLNLEQMTALYRLSKLVRASRSSAQGYDLGRPVGLFRWSGVSVTRISMLAEVRQAA